MLSFHHLAVQCADLEACERFYREVLGLPVLRRWPREGQPGDRSVWLAVGGNEEAGFLALERVEEPVPGPPSLRAAEPGRGQVPGLPPLREAEQGRGRPAPGPWRDDRPGLHLVALQIAPGERRRWEARLAAAGVEVVHRTRWTVYFHDPEGNRVGLTHYPHEPVE